MSRLEPRLDAIFRAYREAVPEPEPGPQFMPGLWERIEARRRYTWRMRRWAGGFVTAAVALCTLMAAFLIWPSSSNSTVYTSTYIDLLRDEMAIAYLVDASLEAPDGAEQ